MSLINNLRSIVWPNKPDTNNPLEVRRWIDAIYVQFDKLKNAFTGEAISDTIVQETTVGLPAVPDKLKGYGLVWDCAQQRTRWLPNGVDCASARCTADGVGGAINTIAVGDELAVSKEELAMYFGHDPALSGSFTMGSKTFHYEYWVKIGPSAYATCAGGTAGYHVTRLN